MIEIEFQVKLINKILNYCNQCKKKLIIKIIVTKVNLVYNNSRNNNLS